MPVHVNWKPSTPPSAMLNTEANFISNLDMANIASVFRNSNGERLVGFTSKVFTPNTMEAELQALLLGFECCN